MEPAEAVVLGTGLGIEDGEDAKADDGDEEDAASAFAKGVLRMRDEVGAVAAAAAGAWIWPSKISETMASVAWAGCEKRERRSGSRNLIVCIFVLLALVVCSWSTL